MKKAILAAIPLLAACMQKAASPSRSSTAPVVDERIGSIDKRVDSIVRAKMLERHIIGAAIAVFDHGRLLKSTAYGMANLATNETVTRRTAFFVASISKVVGAAAAMMLVDDGRVALDDSLGALLGGVPRLWRSVTLHQLLAHTSGLPDVVIPPAQYIATYEAALRELGDTPLRAAPGSQYQYTQTNWAFVAKIIEARAGQSFDEFVTRRVLGPHGVESATFGSYNRVGKGRAEWYTTALTPTAGPIQFGDSAHVLRTDYRDYLHAADGLWISAEDLARWVDAVARGEVLKPESLTLMWTRVLLPAGASSREGLGGWAVNSFRENTLISSEGGARAAVFHVRERGLTVALLTNTQGARQQAWLAEITSLYLTRP
jgi:CubicO group peptidase (beta-lactamase class C family)